MFSRLRLPINQFSEYIMQPISRKLRKTYSTFNPKFQTSKIIQWEKEKLKNNVNDTKNLNLHRRYKSTGSMQEHNKSIFDRTKSLFFLRNIEIKNILEEAKGEENNRVYVTPIAVKMRPKNKKNYYLDRIQIKETDVIPPEEVESEFYDYQYIMDPSYQEILSQEISKMMSVKIDDFNTSGPITWTLVP